MAQYIYALDECDNPIYIESATPGNRYKCPDCKNEVFPKNQGKIKEHHFSHFSGYSHEGAGESENHSNTKMFLYDFFKHCLAYNKDVTIYKRCHDYKHKYYDKIEYGLGKTDFSISRSHIRGTNTGLFYNILEGVNRVEVEYTVKSKDGTLFRPDLALLSGNTLIKAVEVVFTHEDSEEKTKFYQENKIDVIKIDVNNFDTFFEYINRWDYFKNLNSTIFVNSGCRILSTKDMLVSNFKTRVLVEFLQNKLYEVEDVSLESSKLLHEFESLNNDYSLLYWDINSQLQLEHLNYSNTLTFAQSTANSLLSELKSYTKKQENIKQEQLISKLKPLFDELNEIQYDLSNVMEEANKLKIEYGVHMYCIHDDVTWYKDFIFRQKVNDMRKPLATKVTRDLIDRVKKDIISFKNSSKYRYASWFNSKGNERENFIIDYMTDRKLHNGFEFYNQLMYTCMCKNWVY